MGPLLCQGPSGCHPCPPVCHLHPPSFVSPAHTPKVHSVPLSVSLIEILTSTGPSTDLGWTAFITGFHLATDHNPLDVAIYAIPHPSNSPSTKSTSLQILSSLLGRCLMSLTGFHFPGGQTSPPRDLRFLSHQGTAQGCSCLTCRFWALLDPAASLSGTKLATTVCPH